MTEPLQEFVDSGRERLRVDRGAGIIRGVKLLGLASRNGRRYREDALVEARGLYEGAKVNINHPKGHPLSPRDYQDRLGVIRGVLFRAGGGLFGDLHFNPNHALSEQLIWDAEHAPQNVGLSHNVLARTSRDGDDTVVEAISKVQSIDLVADPATTAGLFEHADRAEIEGSWDGLTVAQLKLHRPDLVRELRQADEAKLEELQKQLDEISVREAASRRHGRILELLQEHDLPLPTADGAVDSHLISPDFVDTLMRAGDDETVRELIEERAALVRSASQWNGNGRRVDRRPRSREQAALTHELHRPLRSAEEFAAAIRTQ